MYQFSTIVMIEFDCQRFRFLPFFCFFSHTARFALNSTNLNSIDIEVRAIPVGNLSKCIFLRRMSITQASIMLAKKTMSTRPLFKCNEKFPYNFQLFRVSCSIMNGFCFVLLYIFGLFKNLFICLNVIILFIMSFNVLKKGCTWMISQRNSAKRCAYGWDR